MLDYLFVHKTPCDLFVDFLKTQGLSPKITEDDGSYDVSIPEDIDEPLGDLIESRYDELFDMNRELFEEQQIEDKHNYGGASVVVALSDGSSSYADVDPDLLNKILQAITPEEFGNIVAAIADAVEHPQDKTYCQRLRDDSSELPGEDSV